MKQTKRILAIVLALALGLAVFATGVAAEDPYAPIITMQPKAEKTVVQAGKELKLEVQAMPPVGAEGILTYEWYESSAAGDRLVATSANAIIPISKAMLDNWSEKYNYYFSLNYYVVVTNTWRDDAEQEQTASISSDTVNISVFRGLGDLYTDSWRYASNFSNYLFLPEIFWPIYRFFWSIGHFIGVAVIATPLVILAHLTSLVGI